jgi:hypothetical protein
MKAIGTEWQDREVRPESDLSVCSNSGLASATIRIIQGEQKRQSAIRRLAEIENMDLRPGSEVRMNHTGNLRIVKSIARDGHVFMEGAQIKCSPHDFKLIMR